MIDNLPSDHSEQMRITVQQLRDKVGEKVCYDGEDIIKIFEDQFVDENGGLDFTWDLNYQLAYLVHPTGRKYLKWVFDLGLMKPISLDGQSLPDIDFTKSTFCHFSAKNCIFTNCNFTDAIMTNSDFSGSDFSGSDLSGAQLTCSDLSGANLTGCTITGAKFTRVKYDENTLWPEGFDLDRVYNEDL